MSEPVSHLQQFSENSVERDYNMAVIGSLWLLWGVSPTLLRKNNWEVFSTSNVCVGQLLRRDYAAVTPSCKSPFRQSHIRKITWNWVECGYLVAITGSMWMLQGICGCYRVYVAVTGSMWMLQGLRGCYRVYVAVTGSMWLLQGLCGCYRVYVDAPGSMWMLQGLCGCYRVYVDVPGSMWMLQGLCGCYRVYIPHFLKLPCMAHTGWL